MGNFYCLTKNAVDPKVNPALWRLKVLLHGVDNYMDTLPLEKAMNPTTLVVYEMNGEPLPDRHGAPARIIVPGYFGEKHVKWVTRIEVTGNDSKGFYEQQGWGPDFVVPIRARIDQPDDNAKLSLGETPDGIPLKGIAFAGDRGVARVEVSADDGKNWTDAKIDYPGGEADLGALEPLVESRRTRRLQVSRACNRQHRRRAALRRTAKPILGQDGAV